jgi:hypothetical protein
MPGVREAKNVVERLAQLGGEAVSNIVPSSKDHLTRAQAITAATGSSFDNASTEVFYSRLVNAQALIGETPVVTIMFGKLVMITPISPEEIASVMGPYEPGSGGPDLGGDREPRIPIPSLGGARAEAD